MQNVELCSFDDDESRLIDLMACAGGKNQIEGTNKSVINTVQYPQKIKVWRIPLFLENRSSS